jgi:hypothetical protein
VPESSAEGRYHSKDYWGIKAHRVASVPTQSQSSPNSQTPDRCFMVWPVCGNGTGRQDLEVQALSKGAAHTLDDADNSHHHAAATAITRLRWPVDTTAGDKGRTINRKHGSRRKGSFSDSRTEPSTLIYGSTRPRGSESVLQQSGPSSPQNLWQRCLHACRAMSRV